MIGKGTPDWTFGLNLTAAYKDIDFSVLFSGSLGQDIMDVTRRLDVSSVNVPQEFMKRWHEKVLPTQCPASVTRVTT